MAKSLLAEIQSETAKLGIRPEKQSGLKNNQPDL